MTEKNGSEKVDRSLEIYKDKLRQQPWFKEGDDYQPIPEPEDFKPEEKFPPEHRWGGRPRCQKWNKNTGQQCRRTACAGTTKCYSHGAVAVYNKTTPFQKGAANVNYKHGRYSSSLIANPDLAKAYQEALRQKNLLNLSPNIAMTDAQLSLLYQASFSSSKEIIAAAEKLIDQWGELKVLIPRNGNPALIEALVTFSYLFDQFIYALGEQKAFNEREDSLTERRRRLTETETKRQVSTAETVLKAEAIGVFAVMGNLFRELITREISSTEERKNVLLGFGDIIDRHILGFFGTDEDK